MTRGRVEVKDAQKLLKKQQDEERKRAEMMLPKKNKHLYGKIMFAKKRERQEVRVFFFLYCLFFIVIF